jgi:hypothetical protein
MAHSKLICTARVGRLGTCFTLSRCVGAKRGGRNGHDQREKTFLKVHLALLIIMN